MITNENWIDFCSSFFAIDDKKWLKHVTDNWNTVTNRTGCGCESYHKCNVWRERMEQDPIIDTADLATYNELEEPVYDACFFSLPPELQNTSDNFPDVEDIIEYIELELPKQIES